MFNRALLISLRIIMLRAGPEDLPYDSSRRLSAACIAASFIANLLMAKLLLSTAGAAVLAAATVATMGFYTRTVLITRELKNRIQQTFNALLLTSTIFTVALIWPLRVMLPAMQAFNQWISAHPEALHGPAQPQNLPPGFSSLVELLMLAVGLFVWQLVVTARIFRRAANLQLFGGIFLAILLLFALVLVRSLLQQ